MNTVRSIIGEGQRHALILVMVLLLANCSQKEKVTVLNSANMPEFGTPTIPDKETAELSALLGQLVITKSYEKQIAILEMMNQHDRASILYLLGATQLKQVDYCEYDRHVRDYLAQKCKKYPDIFNETICDKGLEESIRWYAINAVRNAGEMRCFPALAEVFNNSNEPQKLRIQIVMAVMNCINMTPEDMRSLSKGICILLKEKPRETDLSRVIYFAEYGKVKESIPYLINLLDQTEIYSHSHYDDDRGKVPNRISDKAHEALKEITGKDIPCDKEKWKKALGVR